MVRHRYHLYVTSLVLLLLPSTHRGLDADAMATIAAALNPSPPKWSVAINRSSSAYCDWYGVTCDAAGYVTSIDLNKTGLYGPLPSRFPPLPKLKLLSFGVNNLNGPIPLLHNLTSLQVLDLVGNVFDRMPMDFFEGLSSELTFLQLGFNYFLYRWSIPTQLSRLVNLKEFHAPDSNVVGTIPDIFHSCPLNELDLSKNRLVGPLPPSMAKSNLSYLVLYGQEEGLSGSIEALSEIQSLRTVDLTGNRFTGPIPDFSKCKSLQLLSLGINQLTGLVPKSLESLPSLRAMDLSNNTLQGPYPNSLSKKQGVTLDNNNFCTQNGSSCTPQVTTLLQVAAALGFPLKLSESWVGDDACNNWLSVKCDSRKEIIEINFTNQHFYGRISSAFAKLTKLKYLYLSGNNLTGPIPSSLTNLSYLLELDVSHNNISLPIPVFKSKVRVNTTGNPLLGILGSSKGERRRTKLIIFIVVLSIMTIIICTVFVFLLKRFTAGDFEKCKPDKFRKGEQYSKFLDLFMKKENWVRVREIHTISFQKLAAATNNFNQENKLGEGGFGSVYKGRFVDGKEVAVKRLSNASGQGLEEFMNEVVVISKIQHRNLVKLVGFCITKQEKMLVYEYLPNKSLDAFLFDPEKRKVLDWIRRFNIIEGICRGLLYLHQDSRPRIVHRDLKPSNILLDEEFNPKISDFGMARIFGANEDQASTKRVVGTIGYMPREYAMDGRFSEKSDVFSLGVLVLEIISGRRNTSFRDDESSLNLLEHAWKSWNRREIFALIDPVISNQNFHNQILRCIHVGLLCVQDFVKDRPTISIVISMLSGEVDQDLPTPKQPSFLEPQAIGEQFVQNQSKCSINNITITNFGPR